MPFAHRIHYAERGERRPDAVPVLLIHGAGASSAIWMMVLARLARVTRVVAIDLPGHGPSGHDGPAPGMVGFRDAVGGLAATLGLGPSVLVGHSMGALVAMEAALAWPDKVRGLVLCAAAPRLPVDEALLAIIRDDHARFPIWMAEHGLSPAARPPVRRGFAAAGVVTPRAVTLADFQAVAATDLDPRVKDLTCPMVWLDGADDRIVSATPGRTGQIRTLPAVGHMTPLEAPGAVAEAAAELATSRASEI